MMYGIYLRLRHLFYDKGWKKSFTAAVPTVCVGNVTVGGTGKTPHVELILRLLRSDTWAFRHLAVLSRGYKRKSKGFQVVRPDSTAAFAGDEPLQVARKFPDVTVAVDANRVRGCTILTAGGEIPQADAIVLDDAFQYRKLNARLNILLVDYNRPVFKDRLLPWGRLRDLPSRLKAAHVIVVTKCPAALSDWERQQWRAQLRLREEQRLFFTTVSYGTPAPVFPDADPRYTYAKRLVLVSGIANDAPLRSYLSDAYKITRRLAFPDHHRYTKGDLRAIRRAIREQPTACIMTTEKDAQRLRDVPDVPAEIRQRLFCLPIQATFLQPEDENAFREVLLAALQ